MWKFYSGTTLTVLFLFHIICVLKSNGEAYFITNAVHPDHPGKCYFKGPPVTTLSVGETKRLPTSCYKLSCYPEYSLQVTGCGSAAYSGHCIIIKGDIRRPHPHCCPELIC